MDNMPGKWDYETPQIAQLSPAPRAPDTPHPPPAPPIPQQLPQDQPQRVLPQVPPKIPAAGALPHPRGNSFVPKAKKMKVLPSQCSSHLRRLSTMVNHVARRPHITLTNGMEVMYLLELRRYYSKCPEILSVLPLFFEKYSHANIHVGKTARGRIRKQQEFPIISAAVISGGQSRRESPE